MKITVQGRSGRNRPWVARAGRFWPTDVPKLVEVVDTEEDPPSIKVKVRNPTTGRDEMQSRPDPDRIGLASYRTLEADSRLSIKQLDSVGQEAADAVMAAAQEEVARLSRENLELKGHLAQLSSGDAMTSAVEEIAHLNQLCAERHGEIEKLKIANADLQAQLDDAKALIEAMKETAPEAEKVAEGKAAEKKSEKSADKKGDAKKG